MVADVRDVARTAAVSRRWLRLWPRVPALRFASRPASSREASGAERCAALEQYVSFVDDILARRAQSDGCSVESLVISCARGLMPVYIGANPDHDRLTLVSVGAAQEWIRYAFQHGIKSLALDMHLPERIRLVGERIDEGHGEEKPPVVVLHGLPTPARLETMRLRLGGARLRLSSTTVKFTSLKDLSLETIKIVDDGGARLLARLVSSPNCPHLQKLRMSKLWLPDFRDVMRLEADALLELWVEGVSVSSLELRTPSLRVLHIGKSYHEVLSLSAPRLEQVALLFPQGCPPKFLQVHGGLPCVPSLKLCMWSRRRLPSHPNEHHIYRLLFEHCSLLTCLEVNLGGPKEHVDLIKDKIPHLPQIASLTVHVSSAFDRHNFGAGVASLLTRFSNLRHLSLDLPFFDTLDQDIGEELCLECDHPDNWTSHEISVAHLEEVELTGLTGTDCELWFMKVVLASAKRLRKVDFSFNPNCWQYEGKMHAFERVLRDAGMQTSFLS